MAKVFYLKLSGNFFLAIQTAKLKENLVSKIFVFATGAYGVTYASNLIKIVLRIFLDRKSVV
jgi:hypothetical protein